MCPASNCANCYSATRRSDAALQVDLMLQRCCNTAGHQARVVLCYEAPGNVNAYHVVVYLCSCWLTTTRS